MDAAAKKEKHFSGWHALACFFSFFGLMLAVNGVFLFQAITSFPGEDTPKSYLQGLNYNATLAERTAQAETGWRAELGVTGDTLIFRLKDAAGAPIGGQRATLSLRRFATTRQDHLFDLATVGVGDYGAKLEGIGTGRWEAIVQVYDVLSDERIFTAKKSVQIE